MNDINAGIIQAVKKQSLSSVICGQLESMILAGNIKPGERINESRLSSTLGVSRAPIREACRQLERHGMVEVRVNKGTFVKEIDIQEMEELYDIRAALDALAGEKAARSANSDQIKELKGFLDTMREAAGQEDVGEYYKANLEFHLCILRIAGNKNLISIYEGVCKKASLFRQTSLSYPGRLSVSFSQHRSIYDAIAAHDPGKTVEVMKHHLMDAKSILIEDCS